jgi:NAD(P)-dependent dehydrogenase (short-subunit alcohol dehydrogenase family)
LRRRAPDWAIDLLGLWIHQDMQEMRAALECRSVSDLFERHTGSVAEPEEVASVVLFLLSGEASYVLGTNITVSGGR